MRASASAVTCRIPDSSASGSPFRSARPAQSWPPPRTVGGNLWSRAARTEARTSSAVPTAF
ncbi:hypothetical protein AB0D57_47650 [Streptomyces sp. NPDC048275]|uniref:hypothetical protein n=1 Tax=Streptomyces sp. NPDC048275 TaxID=3155629 RepID=UPI0033F51729